MSTKTINLFFYGTFLDSEVNGKKLNEWMAQFPELKFSTLKPAFAKATMYQVGTYEQEFIRKLDGELDPTIYPGLILDASGEKLYQHVPSDVSQGAVMSIEGPKEKLDAFRELLHGEENYDPADTSLFKGKDDNGVSKGGSMYLERNITIYDSQDGSAVGALTYVFNGKHYDDPQHQITAQEIRQGHKGQRIPEGVWSTYIEERRQSFE